VALSGGRIIRQAPCRVHKQCSFVLLVPGSPIRRAFIIIPALKHAFAHASRLLDARCAVPVALGGRWGALGPCVHKPCPARRTTALLHLEPGRCASGEHVQCWYRAAVRAQPARARTTVGLTASDCSAVAACHATARRHRCSCCRPRRRPLRWAGRRRLLHRRNPRRPRPPPSLSPLAQRQQTGRRRIIALLAPPASLCHAPAAVHICCCYCVVRFPCRAANQIVHGFIVHARLGLMCPWASTRTPPAQQNCTSKGEIKRLAGFISDIVHGRAGWTGGGRCNFARSAPMQHFYGLRAI